MPTGYTAGVADGTITTLRQFALLCARGMGACISIRDEPFDTPIPERFEPSSWYADELRGAEARLAELDAMSPEARELAAEAAFGSAHAEWVKRQVERREQFVRYQAMLAEVEAWETDAEGIRDFMLEQLRTSIDFDCRYAESPPPYDPEPAKLTAGEWWRVEVDEALRKITSARKSLSEEVARVEGRNGWLKRLRESLPAEVSE